MIKLNKHGLISNRLIAPEFTVGNTFVEGGGTPEELAVLSLTNEQLAALSYIINGEGRIIPVGEDGTFDTKIGHSYCIRHTDDLTLHEAWLSNDENLYVKRYGSGQLLFFATSEKCKINDPSYIVTEVFRMAALNDFVDWSGIEHYQKWFREVEVELAELLGSRDKFVLEIINDNTLMIHTDRVSDELMNAAKDTAEPIMPATVALTQCNHHIEVSWRDINKYVECKTVEDLVTVNPNYKSDVPSDGEWAYPLTKLASASKVFQNNSRIRKFKTYCPNVYDAELFLASASNLEELHVEWNTAWRISGIAQNCPKLHTVSGFCKSADVAYSSFSQSSSLRNYSLAVPNLRNASGFLNKAILTKESVIFLCNSLPSRLSESGCSITIGIHIDHQNDEEVLEAIANAEAKGWTLTVQWNGTPTSTASTMAMGSLIYAKVVEHELPDGTTEKFLDWGHYVTDETGYETFRSLESAYEYFGLKNPEIE